MNKESKIKEYNEALESIRPFLKVDGGDVEVVDFESSGIVKIQLKGNCLGCSQKYTTIKTGIESLLVQRFAEVLSVEEL